jgi:hypothetical protein
MNLDRLVDNINSLMLYTSIKDNKIVSILKDILTEEDNMPSYSALVSTLTEMAEESGFSGNLFKSYIIHLMLRSQNTFTLMCENGAELKDSSLYRLADRDIRTIKEIASIDLSELPDAEYVSEAIKEVMSYTPVTRAAEQSVTLRDDFGIEDVIKFHRHYGCGDISVYKSFRYSEDKQRLVGVAHPDPITFSQLIGYEAQTRQLKDNTLSFLAGYNANNVLLVGARGTGKSSSVKALVNEYFDKGLRLVEITKEQIVKLPDILKLLRPRGRRFIIFIDDLSFDEGEIEYKYMKSLLEGGTEGKPDNVLFYATSNRRHIVQEKWSDRSSGSEEAELHTTDTLNEKLSLADRFGITLSYPKPSPKEYISIVKGIAGEMGLDVDENTLQQQAMQWEIRQKGMSGRTARQFVNNLAWSRSKEDAK